MAAGTIAKEEQLDCQTIDRSGIVSKYVGETEKRLNKVFLKAWPKNLMLFFDGANVLVGKRSMVKNARDLHGRRHEKRMLVQNVTEIHRAAG